MINRCILGLFQVLFFSFIVFFFSCNRKQEIQKNVYSIISNEIENIEKENINNLLIDTRVYFGLDSASQFNFSELTGSSLLLFYFTSKGCSPCIEKSILLIKEKFENYEDNERIIFVAPDFPLKYYNDYYGKKLLRLINSNLGLPIEKGNHPPFFILIDSNMRVKSIHVVNKNDFDRTKRYLSEINI